jgi:hypothetical protein
LSLHILLLLMDSASVLSLPCQCNMLTTNYMVRLWSPHISCVESFVEAFTFISTTIEGFINKLQVFFLRSWDRPSLIYSSITNDMQRYTMVFITINALHVSGGSSAHHQEPKSVYTALGICRVFLLLTAIVSWNCCCSSSSITIAVRSTKTSTNTRCCLYSLELLMMGRATAWNM